MKKISTRLLVAVLLSGPPIASGEIRFQDVASSAGVIYSSETYGSSWGDYNGDGWPDLFSNNHRQRESLYRNNGNGTFTDVASQVSTLWRDKPKEDTHGGAWGDFDNDGDQDLIVLTGSGFNNQFFINEAGIFRDNAEASNLARFFARARTPLWIDWNNDRKLDLIESRIGDGADQQHEIFRQGNNARFIKSNDLTGFACASSDYVQASNLTGNLKLEIFCPGKLFPDKVYDINTTPFTDITAQFPQINRDIDAVIGDFDNDLRQDLLVVRGEARVAEALLANSRTIHAQLLKGVGKDAGISFKAAADITFDVYGLRTTLNKLKVGSAGTSPLPQASNIPDAVPQGVRFTLSRNDSNNWGIQPHEPTPDGLYIGYDPATQVWRVLFSGGVSEFEWANFVISSPVNITSLQIIGFKNGNGSPQPVLFMNKPAGFQNQTTAAGLAKGVPCISGAAGDFDNDMDLDIYLVCRKGVRNALNVLYENQGNGTFVRVAGAGGAQGPTQGAGDSVSVADYDVDGFLDMHVTNGVNLVGPFFGPDSLFRNLKNTNHWIEIDLVGTLSNRDGVGARVIATAGGVSQLREQNGGIHRWSQHHQRLHFGLAGNLSVNLRIEWPSGRVDTYSAVAADRLYRATESLGIVPVVLTAAIKLEAQPQSVTSGSESETGQATGGTAAPRPLPPVPGLPPFLPDPAVEHF